MIVQSQRKNGRLRVQLKCQDKSLTEQSHKKDCDINNIMRKYRRTGLVPGRTDQPTYGNFTSGTDLLANLVAIQEAKDDFMKLPSELRNRFENDPVQLVDFITDPANQQEAVDLGLIEGTPGLGQSQATQQAASQVPSAEPPQAVQPASGTVPAA